MGSFLSMPTPANHHNPAPTLACLSFHQPGYAPLSLLKGWGGETGGSGLFLPPRGQGKGGRLGKPLHPEVQAAAKEGATETRCGRAGGHLLILPTSFTVVRLGM